MSDAYRTPGRDVDATAVETAKIHEAAATKRKLIEEQEKTRREKIEAWGPIPPVAAGLVIFVAVVTAGIVGHYYVERSRPEPPAPCTDESFDLSAYNRMTCKHPAHAGTLEKVGEKAIYVCRCNAKTADAK